MWCGSDDELEVRPQTSLTEKKNLGFLPRMFPTEWGRDLGFDLDLGGVPLNPISSRTWILFLIRDHRQTSMLPPAAQELEIWTNAKMGQSWQFVMKHVRAEGLLGSHLPVLPAPPSVASPTTFCTCHTLGIWRNSQEAGSHILHAKAQIWNPTLPITWALLERVPRLPNRLLWEIRYLRMLSGGR